MHRRRRGRIRRSASPRCPRLRACLGSCRATLRLRTSGQNIVRSQLLTMSWQQRVGHQSRTTARPSNLRAGTSLQRQLRDRRRARSPSTPLGLRQHACRGGPRDRSDSPGHLLRPRTTASQRHNRPSAHLHTLLSNSPFRCPAPRRGAQSTQPSQHETVPLSNNHSPQRPPDPTPSPSGRGPG